MALLVKVTILLRQISSESKHLQKRYTFRRARIFDADNVFYRQMCDLITTHSTVSNPLSNDAFIVMEAGSATMF